MTLDTPRKFTITSHLQTLHHPSTVPFPTSRAIITGCRDWGADTLGKEELLGLPLLGKIWESGEKEVVIKKEHGEDVCLTDHKHASILPLE